MFAITASAGQHTRRSLNSTVDYAVFVPWKILYGSQKDIRGDNFDPTRTTLHSVQNTRIVSMNGENC